ncbi:EamA family transporter [Halosimplex rubrum]|uniref:EamA family transporter n=1 Tax=Halosimplex rubrum TaxID=869889 RepID=A0A7D5P9X0_9EURY|nr:EamA family transporter [Halosimplex rubrum]QLH77920.1 EamA family transporter [Halosimplex rubrum]
MFGLEPGLAYAVAASLILGVYLFCIKRYFDDYPSTVYVTVTFAASLLWYLPIAAVASDGSLLPAGFGAPGVGMFVLTVGGSILAFLASFRAIAVGDVSYVAPISKIVAVFVLPIELVFLNERLSAVQAAGVVVATAAVYVANYEPGKLLDPFVRAVHSRPAQLALASAAIFGVVDVGKRVLTQELRVPPETYNLVMFAAVPLALAPLAARRWPAWEDGGVRSDLPRFAAVGLLLAVAEHFVMLAFSTLSASLASPVVNTQAVVAVLLGGVVLGEENFRVRLVAAAFAIGGVTMITVG